MGRLQPGKLFLVDLQRGRIVEDEEVKREVSTQRPYGEWFQRALGALLGADRIRQVTISEQPLTGASERSASARRICACC